VHRKQWPARQPPWGEPGQVVVSEHREPIGVAEGVAVAHLGMQRLVMQMGIALFTGEEGGQINGGCSVRSQSHDLVLVVVAAETQILGHEDGEQTEGLRERHTTQGSEIEAMAAEGGTGGAVAGLVHGDDQAGVESGEQVGRGGVGKMVIDIGDRWGVAEVVPKVGIKPWGKVAPGSAGECHLIHLMHGDAAWRRQ